MNKILVKEWIQLPFSRVLLSAQKIKGIRKIQYSVFEFAGDDCETIYWAKIKPNGKDCLTNTL